MRRASTQRSAAHRLLLSPQMPRRRLKILRSPSFRRLGCFFLLTAEVVQIGVTVAAADGLQVKVNVLGVSAIERTEQVTAELLARRAREPLPPPDFAHT